MSLSEPHESGLNISHIAYEKLPTLRSCRTHGRYLIAAAALTLRD